MATGRIGTTPVLQVRWSKAPAGGTTSLSGLDDNSVSLVYSVGYEAVYRNGVLLSRTNDYTATDGTTITLIDATIAGDIIEIFANQTVPLTDTYSQSVANAKYINNTLTTTTGDIIYASAANTPARLAIGSTDQVLKVSGGIPAWGAAAASFVGTSIGKTATQSISNTTFTALTWDTEDYDTDAFHNTSTNTSRITIPSGKGGYYLFSGSVGFDLNATGARLLRLYKNGTDLQTITGLASAGSGDFTHIPFSFVLSLVATDYIELYTYQASGGSLNVRTTSKFQASYLGA